MIHSHIDVSQVPGRLPSARVSPECPGKPTRPVNTARRKHRRPNRNSGQQPGSIDRTRRLARALGTWLGTWDPSI